MATALVLAEPEPETRGFLARHLSDDGFDVIPADDPRDAAVAPDLVLLGDPATLDRWEPGCPVIVLGAADADAVDRVRAFQRGCDDYLNRPFQYEELLGSISTSWSSSISTCSALVCRAFRAKRRRQRQRKIA